MDQKQIETILGKYEPDAQVSILTSLKVVQEHECDIGSDPLLFHIILGEKVRAQDAAIKDLKDDLENSKELTENGTKIKEKEVEIKQLYDELDDVKQENYNLNNKLEHKKNTIEDIEEIIDRKEEELK